MCCLALRSDLQNNCSMCSAGMSGREELMQGFVYSSAIEWPLAKDMSNAVGLETPYHGTEVEIWART